AFLTVHANGFRGIRATKIYLHLHHSLLTDQAVGAGLFIGKGKKAVTVDHVLFAGNRRDINDTNPPVIVQPLPGTVLTGQDPLYVDPDGDDGQLGGAHWADDDLSLRQPPAYAETSPAVDASTHLPADPGPTGSPKSWGGPPGGGLADLGAPR